jgi:transcriptional regulator with XRE-family HTH domain
VARISGQSDTGGQLIALGGAMRAARKAQGMSQETLADAAGIERAHLGKIERGERNVTLLNLIRIATALKAKPSSLLDSAGL